MATIKQYTTESIHAKNCRKQRKRSSMEKMDERNNRYLNIPYMKQTTKPIANSGPLNTERYNEKGGKMRQKKLQFNS